jgi:chromosome partitioning protein
MTTQPRKCAICNQKGGVGKTATALGLASAISARGGKVLVVDMDPQGNATTGLGITVGEDMLTTFDLMSSSQEGAAADAVVATDWDGVDLIPATHDLANIEADGANDLIFRLDIAFEGTDLSAYDAVLFDCPPSLGKLLFAVLCAADGVIAITEPTIDSVRGVENLEETIRNVQRRPNPRLIIDKVVLSRKRKTGEHIYREAELRESYGSLVARTGIPELAARQDAHSAHVPIHQFSGGKSLALRVAYNDLLDELPIGPIGVMA